MYLHSSTMCLEVTQQAQKQCLKGWCFTEHFEQILKSQMFFISDSSILQVSMSLQTISVSSFQSTQKSHQRMHHYFLCLETIQQAQKQCLRMLHGTNAICLCITLTIRFYSLVNCKKFSPASQEADCGTFEQIGDHASWWCTNRHDHQNKCCFLPVIYWYLK